MLIFVDNMFLKFPVIFLSSVLYKSNMNTKTTFAVIAAVAILAAALTPTFLTEAAAKISPRSCENAGGQQPPGQQPNCKGQGLEQNPATNPAGHAPPGQNN